MDDIQEVDTRQLIIDKYLEIISTKRAIPVQADFTEQGIKRDQVRYHFGNMDSLHQFMSDNYNEEIGKFFSTVDNIFKRIEDVKHKLNNGRYIISTAVADSPADTKFLAAMDNYCARNDAKIFILPCESITNSFERRTATFDKVFNDENYTFITDDTALNDNISLCTIQVSAKQIKPITGLNRLGQREGSYVFASPKQFLEYIPSGNSREKNYAIMTPGSCTKPSYYTETFVSKRLSYIADQDHTMGAIIVEIEDDKVFHFRQIQADKNGSFIDLGIEYNAKGEAKPVPVNVVLGDIHARQVNMEVLDSFIGAVSGMSVRRAFLHDIFDGHSINHHIANISERARRSLEQKASLINELHLTRSVIEYIHEGLGASRTYIVKSNHDEFLDRYLAEGRYISDPENHYTSLKIAPSLFEGDSPLERGLNFVSEKPMAKSIEFLTRDSDIEVAGVQCAAHGDLGLNGAKSSLNGLEKIYGKCVVGHTHSGAIQRDVFRVGTFTELDLGYNRGPSSWTHTGCLLYENGQRQLVNYINGKFYKDQNTIEDDTVVSDKTEENSRAES